MGANHEEVPPGWSGLISLNLSFNHLRQNSLRRFPFFPELRHLELLGVEVNDIDIQAVAWCTNLETLTVTGRNFLTDECLLNILKLKRLRTLRLYGQKGVSPGVLGPLAKITSPLECLRAIATIPSLTKVAIDFDDPSESVWKYLAPMKELRSLEVYFTPHHDDLKYIQQVIPRLEKLTMRISAPRLDDDDREVRKDEKDGKQNGSDIDNQHHSRKHDEYLAPLQEFGANITHLEITGNFTDLGIKALGRLDARLQELEVCTDFLSDDSFATIANLRKLRVLRLLNESEEGKPRLLTKIGLARLSHQKALRELQMSDPGFTAEDIQALGPLPMLHKLLLNANRKHRNDKPRVWSKTETEQFYAHIAKFPQLRHLTLNTVDKQSPTREAMAHIAKLWRLGTFTANAIIAEKAVLEPLETMLYLQRLTCDGDVAQEWNTSRGPLWRFSIRSPIAFPGTGF